MDARGKEREPGVPCFDQERLTLQFWSSHCQSKRHSSSLNSWVLHLQINSTIVVNTYDDVADSCLVDIKNYIQTCVRYLPSPHLLLFSLLDLYWSWQHPFNFAGWPLLLLSFNHQHGALALLTINKVKTSSKNVGRTEGAEWAFPPIWSGEHYRGSGACWRFWFSDLSDDNAREGLTVISRRKIEKLKLQQGLCTLNSIKTCTINYYPDIWYPDWGNE